MNNRVIWLIVIGAVLLFSGEKKAKSMSGIRRRKTLGDLSDKPKLVGYEWRSDIFDAVKHYWDGSTDIVGKRQSDWDKSDISKGSGREIVHVYYIQEPDGTVNPYGKITALKRLGYDNPQKLDKQAQKFIDEAMNRKRRIEAELDQMSRAPIGDKASEANRLYLVQQNEYRPRWAGYVDLKQTVVYKRNNEYLTSIFYPERVEALAQMGFKPYMNNTTHEKYGTDEIPEARNSIKKAEKMIPESKGQMALFGGVKEIEPYEMTKKEYLSMREEMLKGSKIRSPERYYRNLKPDHSRREWEYTMGKYHKEFTKEAIEKGINVSSRVINEYPELKKKIIPESKGQMTLFGGMGNVGYRELNKITPYKWHENRQGEDETVVDGIKINSTSYGDNVLFDVIVNGKAKTAIVRENKSSINSAIKRLLAFAKSA